MAERARNEGFRLMPEFICEAIPEPGMPKADPKNLGRNEGARVIHEFVLEAEGETKEASETEDREVGRKG